MDRLRCPVQGAEGRALVSALAEFCLCAVSRRRRPVFLENRAPMAQSRREERADQSTQGNAEHKRTGE
jgi:hypothetical protein